MKATREVQFSFVDRVFSQVDCIGIYSHIAPTLENMSLSFLNASD